MSVMNVMKHAALALMILLVVAMLPAEALAFEYHGEDFAAGTPSNDPLFGAAKIGKGYFFMDNLSGEDSTLYYQSSKSGGRVKLHYAKTADDQIGWTVVFDGNKVYYTVSSRSGDQRTYKVYSVNKNGTGRKCLKTFKSSYDRTFDLISIHDGRLYFQYGSSKNIKLYAINLKSGKCTVREEHFRFITPNDKMDGNGRYLVGRTSWSDDDNSLKVYDCETTKCTVRIEDRYVDGHCLGSKYLYFITRNPQTYEQEAVYRVNLNGKYKPKKVFDPKAAGAVNIWLQPGKIYYDAETDVQWEYEYFVYDISKDTVTELSQKEFTNKAYR